MSVEALECTVQSLEAIKSAPNGTSSVQKSQDASSWDSLFLRTHSAMEAPYSQRQVSSNHDRDLNTSSTHQELGTNLEIRHQHYSTLSEGDNAPDLSTNILPASLKEAHESSEKRARGKDDDHATVAASTQVRRESHVPVPKFPNKSKSASIVSGVGLNLERTEGSGLLIVKRIAKDSVAAIDGRICINDTLLKVFPCMCTE